jgi:hypothetical protein
MIMALSLRVTRRNTRALPGIIKYLGVMGAMLVALAFGSVVYYSLSVTSAKALSLDSLLGLEEIADESVIPAEMLDYDIPMAIDDPAALPDIYYIILDEYANAKNLLELHGFDNSAFLDAMRGRGFYVAEDSRANYPATFLSLASSLNMDYMNFLAGYGRDFAVPYHLIDYSRVSGILRNAGYQIVYFPSIYYVTRDMESGDFIYRLERELPVLEVEYSSFDLELLDSTLLGALLNEDEDFDITNDYREATWFALDNTRTIPLMDGPTFAFIHITVPHRPYVFTADDAPANPGGTHVDGIFIGAGTYAPFTEESNILEYLDQVNYINRAIAALVDDIIASSDTPPIIIIQSDHGNRMQHEPGVDDWGPAEIYQNVFPILNMYYLPGYDMSSIDPAITPVNTFRMIFDFYLGTELGLIENRSFYPDEYFNYDFTEVTDGILREVPPAVDTDDD